YFPNGNESRVAASDELGLSCDRGWVICAQDILPGRTCCLADVAEGELNGVIFGHLGCRVVSAICREKSEYVLDGIGSPTNDDPNGVGRFNALDVLMVLVMGVTHRRE